MFLFVIGGIQAFIPATMLTTSTYININVFTVPTLEKKKSHRSSCRSEVSGKKKKRSGFFNFLKELDALKSK